MKKSYIQALLFVFLLISTVVGGMYAGQNYLHRNVVPSAHDKPTSLHTYFHKQLNITDEQDKFLTDIERRYLEKRKYIEEKMKVANMELANGIKEDRKYSPRVQSAIDNIHKDLGELQKITIEHLFEMQTVLTPEQNRKMDQMVTDALYHNHP